MANEKWLKEALDKLENKVDKLDQRLDNVDVTLGKQHLELKQHIYRTELNEESIAMLRDDFKPVNEHVAMISGVLKFSGIVSLIIGIITGALKILEVLKIIP